MKLALRSPAAHSLVECLKELKFGRPAEEQKILDEFVISVQKQLGNDGPGFSPDTIMEVFNKEQLEDHQA